MPEGLQSANGSTIVDNMINETNTEINEAAELLAWFDQRIERIATARGVTDEQAFRMFFREARSRNKQGADRILACITHAQHVLEAV